MELIILLFWIIVSERFSLEGLLIGIIISLTIAILNKENFGNVTINSILSFKKMKIALIYFILLLKEIFSANIHVAKVVLGRKLEISPKFVPIKTYLKNDNNKSIYANSITLTPGTLTVMIDEDTLLVHCLDEKSANSLEGSIFESLLMEVENR